MDKSKRLRRPSGTKNKEEDCRSVRCIDIRNVFNSARWNYIVAVLQKKKTLKYLTRMIRNYLRDRQIIYEDDDCSIQEKMTRSTARI